VPATTTIAPNNALGFTFPGPAGPVTAIDIFVERFRLARQQHQFALLHRRRQYVHQRSGSIAGIWEDLYPPGGGGVFFNTFPPTGGAPARAVITWSAVPEFFSDRRSPCRSSC